MEKAEIVASRLGARIREARRAQGITLLALSEKSNLSTGFLSRVERGEASASIANLITISACLDMPLKDLFEDDSSPSAPPDYVISRSKERLSETPLSAVGYTFHRSCGDLPGQQITAFELEFAVGDQAGMALVSHEGEEILYLLEGKIEFQIGNDRLVMERGDCIHFNCEKPHRGRNIGSKVARLLMVVSSASSIKRRFKGAKAGS